MYVCHIEADPKMHVECCFMAAATYNLNCFL